MPITSNLYIRIKDSFTQYLAISLLFGMLLLLTRLYEAFIISIKADYPSGSWQDHISGLAFDANFFLHVSFWLLGPFILIGSFNLKAQKNIFGAISTLIALGNIILIQYFGTARVPLGADLFGYSGSEITHTLEASHQITISNLFACVLMVIAGFIAFSRPLPKLKLFAQITLPILMLSAVTFGKMIVPTPAHYASEFDLFVATNKVSFFTESVSAYLMGSESYDPELIASGQETGESAFEYVNPDYPLLHKEKTPDVLGQYFNKARTLPSFVIIVVESLGRSYSGRGAVLGSFTPFLDSLMQKSLYWENNLSTSGRTFEVLPSLLGSLPFGKNGFAEMGDKMPDHLSLLSLLKKRAGYHTGFYYGGDTHFDNMDLFMHRQNIDKIINSNDFGNKYERMLSAPGGFSWGYGDKELFRKYIDNLSATELHARVDVLLTLSIHDPFRVPQQEYYNRQVERRMAALMLSDKQIEFNQSYIPQLATVLYFDDALREFMDTFSKRKEFANTIFIITGDHRMPEIPISTQIDRFRVPLVIYSPLLKKGQTFSSVVSHFDLTPSLLAFMQKNYGILQPSVSAWIGHGLDVNPDFQVKQSYPLMRNKNEFMDYIDPSGFYAGDYTYKVSENLEIELTENAELKDRLQKKFKRFRAINQFVCRRNRIIPDSIRIKQFK